MRAVRWSSALENIRNQTLILVVVEALRHHHWFDHLMADDCPVRIVNHFLNMGVS